ncbi:MAG: hypothetical protein QOH05_4062, partial [Acetobacteraceae bacterium]|nr:hypothetical protein [Acetobacteraceae bacterium]
MNHVTPCPSEFGLSPDFPAVDFTGGLDVLGGLELSGGPEF